MLSDRDEPVDVEAWRTRIHQLARQQDAQILAHNYQDPLIQEIADYVGDSLELARKAASSTASTIVFCGVYFMAETAKILAADKRVLIPDRGAGCSLSSTIDAQQLRAWKAEYPGAVVIMYVNTSAEVKAEADYCCTSANASQVVASLPPDQEILFGPDLFLGEHVIRETGRKMHLWLGECHVHAGIAPSDLQNRLKQRPNAELLIHPECGCASQAMYLASVGDLPAERTHILGTGGMLAKSRVSTATEFIVATEIGMVHRLREANPAASFVAANPAACCSYMKMITPANLADSLEQCRHEVTVAPETADRARSAIERMLAIN